MLNMQKTILLQNAKQNRVMKQCVTVRCINYKEKVAKMCRTFSTKKKNGEKIEEQTT